MKAWIAALLLASCSGLHAETYQFALIGDTPYSAEDRQELPRMLAAIVDRKVSFIAHIGDIKNGRDRCDDALFIDRHELFNALPTAFIFVPGDNEWTDCERISNGGFNALERLDKLRSLFWRDALSLGQQKITVERQTGNYPEHSRFRLGPVLFVTFNLPGGNNYFGFTNQPSQEFEARNPVLLSWLKDNFALARRENLTGIVLLFHANPGFKDFAKGLPHRGYRDFLERLQQEVLTFKGQVVAVHGDTHINRINHPLRDTKGKKLPNFTRVETFGSPFMGWTQGIIDTHATPPMRFEENPWPPR